MTENQRKWLLDLQSKGLAIEYLNVFGDWEVRALSFVEAESQYRLAAQPIPDIPDWRDVCRDMQSKGLMFEGLSIDAGWIIKKWEFIRFHESERFRIPQQPIPEWKEEMTEETKPTPETPHRDLQIQWHKDWIHHLKTGEPMREWQWRNTQGKWIPCYAPNWDINIEYRRKPRTVTYWHSVCKNIYGGGYFSDNSGIGMTKENYIKLVNEAGGEVIQIFEQSVEVED